MLSVSRGAEEVGETSLAEWVTEVFQTESLGYARAHPRLQN